MKYQENLQILIYMKNTKLYLLPVADTLNLGLSRFEELKNIQTRKDFKSVSYCILFLTH